MDTSRELHFDGWTLYTAAGELVKDATRIRLQSQPLQILVALLACPGELVTREQLIARLWPRGIVDFDTALNSAVHRLRTALGDHPDSPRYIETIPRRGYRFIGRLDTPPVAPPATVEPEALPAAGPVPTPRRWLPAAAALVLVVLAVAAVLSLRTGDRSPANDAPGVAVSEAAQERYLRAEHFFQRRAPGDIERARKYFSEAVEIEPGFARAWAGLASAYWLATVQGGMPPEQGLARVRDAAERALALDPRLAEAHVRLANYRWITGDRRAGDEHLAKALELEPDNALVLSVSAGSAAEMGQFDIAIELQRRAVAADPLSVLRRYNLAAILYQAGRLDEAKAELLSLRELSPASSQFSDLLGLVLILEGRFDEALQLAGELDDDLERQQIMALAYDGLGRRMESDAALGVLIETAQGEDRYLIAEVLAYRGETDAAFEWLHTATGSIDVPPWLQGGRRWRWLMPHSPFLRSLHSDPRWNAWLESAQ